MPKVVLADRMGCLKGGVVANVVVPTPAYVRFASLYGFRPDFCEGGDPESKGVVENLVGYAKSDLVVPQDLARTGAPAAQRPARTWCDEVNAQVHSETCAVPASRLEAERPLLGPLPSLRPGSGRVMSRKVDRLSYVRFGSARYSVPTKLVGRVVEVQVSGDEVQICLFGEVVAAHSLVAPGQASVQAEHYGGPRRAPERRPRPHTAAEKAICGLGEIGEAFIKGAAAAGVTKLGAELEELVGLEAAHGREPFVAGLARAVEFGRFRASDVRSIIAAGSGFPRAAAPGPALVAVDLPQVPRRPLTDYATGEAS